MVSSISVSILARTVFMVSFTLSLQAVAADKSIVVGIFSPDSTPISDIGASQDYLVEKGFQEADSTIKLEGSTIRIGVISHSTTRFKDCNESLREFKKNNPSAVAIIGPIRSDCAKSMLETDPELPIITAMASATNLTNTGNNQWFFRANITDKARLEKLLKFINLSEDFQDKDTMLVYDADSEYGNGLKKDFSHLFRSVNNIEIQTVDDVVKSETDLKVLLSNKNLFVLGDADKILALAKKIRAYELEKKIDALSIFSVGSPTRLSEFGSDRLITIGEVDFLKDNSVKVEQEFERIKRDAEIAKRTFYPTIYVASRYILYNALMSAILIQADKEKPQEKQSNGEMIKELRGLIRDQLKEGKFPSPTPFKILEFDNYNLKADFEYPIYQLGWGLNRLDQVVEDRRWVELIDHSPEVGFLETPVMVTVIGHNLGETKAVVLLTNDSGKEKGRLEFNQNKSEDGIEKNLEFHVLPGSYIISSNPGIYPKNKTIVVGFSNFYGICLIMAIVGVFIRVRPYPLTWRLVFPLMEGTLVALIFAVGITYLRYKFFQEFTTDADFLNAAIYGLIGGYLGVQIFESTIARFLRR